LTHARNGKDQFIFFLLALAMLEENDVSLPFHLVADERSRDGWDVPAWIIQQTASVTIQPEAGHMIMPEISNAFYLLFADSFPRRIMYREGGRCYFATATLVFVESCIYTQAALSMC
jgi:hypothetical protein